jgi:catechol 2,3-dioxygenase-like lactoylglutathione lyase family enzyme
VRRPEFLRVAPHFTVPDVVEAARYYVEVLGFENRGFFGSPPVFAMLGRGPVEIYFNQDPASRGAVRVRAPVGADAYFHVRRVDDLHAELKERGARIVDGPVTRVYRMRELVVDDCHGLRLVFGEDAS